GRGVAAGGGLMAAAHAYFGRQHPLAQAARTRCRAAHGSRPGGLLRRGASGPGWGRTHRAGGRVAAPIRLPPGDPPAQDPLCPDPIAVERAIAQARAGQPVRGGLPRGVRAELARMIRDREAPWTLLPQLGISGADVARLAALADQHPARGPEVA